MGDPVRMCSAPSCSMITVPEATVFPSVFRPMRRSKSRIVSSGKPSGNTGNGRSSVNPISSQWPVTESLPGDRSAIRPYAAAGAATGSPPGRSARRDRPMPRRVGICSVTRRAMFPSVWLPSSP